MRELYAAALRADRPSCELECRGGGIEIAYCEAARRRYGIGDAQAVEVAVGKNFGIPSSSVIRQRFNSRAGVESVHHFPRVQVDHRHRPVAVVGHQRGLAVG